MELTKVESSHIAAIGYLEAERVLLVRYKDGSLYAIPGMPESVWHAFLAAESKGRYLARIRENMVKISKGVMPTEAGTPAIRGTVAEPGGNAAPSPGPLNVIDEDADKCCREFFAALGPSGLCIAEALTCRDCGTQFTPSTVGPNRHWRMAGRRRVAKSRG